MKKLIIILLVLFSITAFGQYRYTMAVGEYAISSLGSTTYVTNNTRVVNWPTPIDRATAYKYVASGANLDTLTTTRTKSGFLYVGLEPGGTFTGTLTVADDSVKVGPGAVANIRSGKSGAKPKIYGSDILTGGWTIHSGNIWKKTITTDITQLFANGDRMVLARHSNTGYDVITAGTDSAHITIDTLSAGLSYVGARIGLRGTSEYHQYTRNIISSTGNTIAMDYGINRNIAPGQAVLIFNKLEFLDSPKEWYYDKVGKILYAWMPNGDSPANYEVRGSVRNYGMSVIGKNYVSVNNIHFLQQSLDNVLIKNGATDLNFSNNKFESAEMLGIRANNGNHIRITVDSNEFTDQQQGGVLLYNTNLNSNYIITNNHLHDIGNFATLGYWGCGQENDNTIPWANVSGSTALAISGDNSEVAYNRIERIALNGIFWRYKTRVHHNYIKDVCLHWGDGGGIYAGSPTTAGSVIEYNVVDGAYAPFDVTAANYPWSQGIYLDAGHGKVRISNNSILNVAEAGIFISVPLGDTVTNNTTFNCGYGFNNRPTASGVSTITGNTFVTNGVHPYTALTTDQRVIRTNTPAASMVFNNNNYVNNFATNSFRVASTDYNLATWKTLTGNQDAGSAYYSSVIGVEDSQKMYYNVTKTAQTISFPASDTVYYDVFGNVVTSFVLQPYTSKVIIKDVPAPVPDIRAGLQVHYAFEGTGSTIVDSMGNQNATPVNVTGGATAPVGSGYTFNGVVGTYATIPYNALFRATNWSLAIRVKPNTWDLNRYVFTLPNTTGNYGLGAYMYNVGGDGMRVTYGSGTGIAGVNILMSNNQFHNVVFTYSSADTKLKMYVDGVLLQNITTAFAWNPANTAGELAKSVTSNTLSGVYDEFSFWNITLTEAQVLRHNNGGSSLPLVNY